MLLELRDVLTTEQVSVARHLLSAATFVDGRLSAGLAAGRVKRNEEADAATFDPKALNNLVMGSLVRHPVYLNGALPHRVAAPAKIV